MIRYRNSYQKIYEDEFFEGLTHGNRTSHYAFSFEAYGMENPKEKQGPWNHGNFIQGGNLPYNL